MRRLAALLLCCGFFSFLWAQDNSLKGYQYWFDADVAGKTAGSLSEPEEEVTLSINTSNLRDGLHTLFFRFEDKNGKWSQLDSWLFLKSVTPAGGASVSGYEYWIDTDYEKRVTGTTDQAEISFAVDASALANGLHTLNYRVKDVYGRWSYLDTWLFLKSSASDGAKVNGYEYWIDDDYAGRVAGEVEGTEISFAVNTSSLKDGMHTLNYRVKDERGRWSYLEPWIFIKQKPQTSDAKIVWYRYWWNDHFQDSEEVQVEGTEPYIFEQKLLVPDVVKKEKSSGLGVATLSVMFGDDKGNTSPTATSEVKDGVPPVSTINELPKEANEEELLVTWGGTDDWSGIKDYSVYISENGQEFKEWKKNTIETSGIYRCHEYQYPVSFFVIARDSLDNEEAMKTQPDVAVTFMYVDSVPPVSSITPLPPVVYDTSVSLSWTGKDDVNEVQDYTIYLSENDKPFTPWLENTTETGATFTGKYNTTYRFVSVARDTKGNVEVLDEEKAVSVFLTEHAVVAIQLKDQLGKPLEGVEVTLGKENQSEQKLTDADGKIEFTGFEIGTWQLSTWKAGFKSLNKELILVGGTNSVTEELAEGWSELVITKDQYWGQRGPEPFAGFYEFDDLTLADNVMISSSGISHLVIYVKGKLKIGKNAVIRVRNGYYPESPTTLPSMISETNMGSYGFYYKNIYLFPDVFGRGGNGGDGSDGTYGLSRYMNAGYGVYYWLDGSGGSGGGGGGGGYGGGKGGNGGRGRDNIRTGKYQAPDGWDGKDNGGDGGYAGSSDVLLRGGGATRIGDSRMQSLLPGGGSGGGGNGGYGGSGGYVDNGILTIVSGTSGNGGGGGGYGGGVLTIVANEIECESQDDPIFLVSGQLGGMGGDNGKTKAQAGMDGQGGLLIIHAGTYAPSESHWSLGNNLYEGSTTLGVLRGNPQQVLVLDLPEGFNPPTSASGAPEENGARVYGASGKIIVEHAKIGTAYRVFDMSGALLKASTFESEKVEIPVMAGMYIVGTGDKSFKVVVR